MTAEAFFAWAQAWTDGERYELVEGVPVRLQAERVSHAERKAAIWLALREAGRAAGRDDCRAFPDGVGVHVSARIVREPDTFVHRGPCDGASSFAPNPIVVVEVVSPSSRCSDSERKHIDYFAVASILPYLVVFDDGRVVHHSRLSSDAPIATAILGRDGVIDLSPPGLRIAVSAVFEDA